MSADGLYANSINESCSPDDMIFRECKINASWKQSLWLRQNGPKKAENV